MIDIDAAIGFVVAKGDHVDRARLSYLRTGALPAEAVLERAENGQAYNGGWPAFWAEQVASVDATCFHLAELDDLGALGRPSARRALDWLATRQQANGLWEEDKSLAAVAPDWARPGDPEAALYITANAAYWLTVAGLDARSAGPLDERPGGAYAGMVVQAAEALREQVQPDGTMPTFLVATWLTAAVLYRQDMFYESVRLHQRLIDRMPELSAADAAWLAASNRRVGVRDDDRLIITSMLRLRELQRTDGGFTSDDGDAFDVHTTLMAIRACR
ncbi:prenyltransferase/squalene oxidase repeat-containing protein [Hamadaea tsunoensis]|uniref:squalene--hopene cyclase n=1 Tax=Hamadaea tsunoensis TaxID=53368 RepID=UPI00041631DC|nr:squalene--hopene cyclase [Hamadaea tsunoensis]